jgi:hypothetical protein
MGSRHGPRGASDRVIGNKCSAGERGGDLEAAMVIIAGW